MSFLRGSAAFRSAVSIFLDLSALEVMYDAYTLGPECTTICNSSRSQIVKPSSLPRRCRYIPLESIFDGAYIHYLVPGVVGLASYVYLEYSDKPPVAVKKVQEKSPFDPENFVDFKLKKIEDYNHNTSKCVSLCFVSSHIAQRFELLNLQICFRAPQQ